MWYKGSLDLLDKIQDQGYNKIKNSLLAFVLHLCLFKDCQSAELS